MRVHPFSLESEPGRTKWIVCSVIVLLAITSAWVAHSFYFVWQRFVREERICGAFHPVISALDEFQQQTGSLPTNLTQLIPQYLKHLPSAPVADAIDYRVLPDGTNWQLSVRSSVRGKPELFVQRSSRDFTAEEQRQSVTSFHGWSVFSQP